MKNIFKVRRGSSKPTIDKLKEFELGWDKINKELYINNNNEEILNIGGGAYNKAPDTSQLINLFYPIGTLFWTKEASINPNTHFPGTTWEQVKDKFILAEGDSYNINDTGGRSTYALTVANMPSHSHTITSSSTSAGSHTHSASGSSGSAGAHTHTTSGTAASAGSHTHKSEGYFKAGSGTGEAISRYRITADPTDTNAILSAGAHTHKVTGTAASAGSHSHTISVSVTSAGSHSHTITSSASETGSGNAFNIMPPYEVAYCWKRIS